MVRFTQGQLNSRMRAAQRKGENDARRLHRELERKITTATNKLQRDVERDLRREVNRLVAQLNKPVRVTSPATPGLNFSPTEHEVAERVRAAVATRPDRQYDFFCSYAKLDGYETARAVCDNLESLGASVWFDDDAMKVGRSMSRAMDLGLARSRAGIVVVTPAYLAGRFWPERELGALLHKDIVVPVLHNVTFEQLGDVSPFLADTKGFTTAGEDPAGIAAKIFAAVSDVTDEVRG